MTDEYKTYIESNLAIKQQVSELNKLKQQANERGDTWEVIKINAEMIRLNRMVILTNQKMKDLITDAQRKVS